MDNIDRLLNIATTIGKIYQEISICEFNRDNNKVFKLKKDLELCQEIENERLEELDLNKIEEYMKYIFKKSANIYFFEFFKCIVYNKEYDPALRVKNKIAYYYNKCNFFSEFNTKKLNNPYCFPYIFNLYINDLLLYFLNNNFYYEPKYYDIRYKSAFYFPEIEKNIWQESFMPQNITSGLLEYSYINDKLFGKSLEDYAETSIDEYLRFIKRLPQKYYKNEFLIDKKYHEVLIKYLISLPGILSFFDSSFLFIAYESVFNETYNNFIVDLLRKTYKKELNNKSV